MRITILSLQEIPIVIHPFHSANTKRRNQKLTLGPDQTPEYRLDLELKTNIVLCRLDYLNVVLTQATSTVVTSTHNDIRLSSTNACKIKGIT
ncbi:hypothetical protein TNCT_734991 [Trichonephila clavata]|uniref:Uncharacterized protein n=1 Tax=Trichonephila clavata TaxID=2740835 RepID=A0A8X6L3Q2_TRICU|nr:hypothetical protein TNCT_734991 [Trichonephila clavata]